MKRRWLAGMLLVCLLGSAAMARHGEVKTRDGRTFRGDISPNPAGLTILSNNIRIVVPNEDVERVTYIDSIEEQYRQRLAELPPDAGPRARYALARWLFENRQYELALEEAEAALKLDPNYTDAAVLKDTIQRQRWIDRPRPPQPGGGTATAPPAGGAATRPAGGLLERRLLSPEQINTIRQAEMKETDTNIRVRFQNNVIRRFIESDNRNPNEFGALSDYQKAMEILQRGKPDMRKDVIILNDPASLAQFKRTVAPILLGGCASSNCHGGQAGGSLVLYNPAEGDAAHYTNFYILTRYSTRIGAAQRKAIDRVFPEQSLILQMALPPSIADFDHPEVPGMRPLFANPSDARYKAILEWIRDALVPVEPSYLLDYQPPRGTGAATKPATRP